jgi:hypothetical protein
MAASAAAKEGLWLRRVLADLGVSIGAVEMKCDNQAALALITNPLITARSKHIDVMHHFVGERAARREVAFSYIRTEHQVADCMTKPLSEIRFAECCLIMGVC